jgi:Ca2+/Na+ antiporter
MRWLEILLFGAALIGCILIVGLAALIREPEYAADRRSNRILVAALFTRAAA